MSQSPYGQPPSPGQDPSPYAQSPFGGPQQPQAPTGEPFGQPPAQGPYGQPPQPYATQPTPYPGSPQPYGPASAYGGAPYAPAVAPKAPPTLAVIGFALLVVGTIGGLYFGYQLSSVFVQLLVSYNGDIEFISQTDQTALDMASFPVAAFSLIGIAGWVLSIVATAKKSLRPLAITGIVLGVLAPLLIVGAMVYAWLPWL